jgi:glycosyltransferase involved in cell wall biosynthesis
LTPQKGIEQLLRVVDAMAEKTVHVRVGGTGDDEYVEALKSEYASPQVTFCGTLIPMCFSPHSMCWWCRRAGMSRLAGACVEAYGHGVPVIAAQRGGLPEIVDEGETGWT